MYVCYTYIIMKVTNIFFIECFYIPGYHTLSNGIHMSQVCNIYSCFSLEWDWSVTPSSIVVRFPSLQFKNMFMQQSGQLLYIKFTDTRNMYVYANQYTGMIHTHVWLC